MVITYLKYSNFISSIIVITFILLMPCEVLSQADSTAESTADSTTQFKSSLSAYPYVYYTPETQLAFGAGGVYTFYTKQDASLNPSNFTASGYYATIKTYQLIAIQYIF